MPDILMLCAIADSFGVTTDELLGRTKEVKYAVIFAENSAMGRKVAEIAKSYGLFAKEIHTDIEQAKAAALADDTVEYLIVCSFSGFYTAEPGVANLVSVAPTEAEVLNGIRQVLNNYLKD